MDEQIPGVVARAVETLRAHEAVERVTVHIAGSEVLVNADFRVSMASRWLEKGCSPTGVLSLEPVRLSFGRDFPVRAPRISLRADFNRAHPHINPGSPTEPPVPCLVDGSLSEYMHVAGFVGIVNQISVWLDNAASGTLIDPAQGWEPIRRDEVPHAIAANADCFRSWVDGRERFCFVRCEYVLVPSKGGNSIYATLHSQPTSAGVAEFSKYFAHRMVNAGYIRGQTLALIVLPGKRPDGGLVKADKYHPETASVLADLPARASDYGSAKALKDGLDLLRSRMRVNARLKYQIVLPVILLAVRPINIIRTASPIELIPYVAQGTVQDFISDSDSLPLSAASHVQSLSPQLLRRLSGVSESFSPAPWILLGAGSLGSHIGIAMARMGDGPSTVIDKDYLSPHNAARHALIPGDVDVPVMNPKAMAMQGALACLAQKPKALIEDAIELFADTRSLRSALPKGAWGLVNTTASLAAREAILAAPGNFDLPVLEAGLYGRGAAGTLAVESADGNPNIGDIEGDLYELARLNETLKIAVFPDRPAHEGVDIGQGCNSVTMTMTDAQVSQFASTMVQVIADLRQTGLPRAGGRLWIGLREGIQVSWQEHVIDPCKVVEAEGSPWSIRIAATVAQAISDQATDHPNVETGGILMGRISEAARCFFVTGTIPAPADSVQSPGQFVLGTAGVTQAIQNYTESAGGSLYCLGTWHSHLTPSGPSMIDRQTAAILGWARIAPSVMLIRSPSAFRAIVTERH
ncbi:ThiF family adenylyltransferase [Thiocapsa rosea]|nr:ThiF family adenylyltransferase [Thiocapsa rosea]